MATARDHANQKLCCRRRGDGLSKCYASQVRAEKFTPHVSTWRAFEEQVGVTQPARYAR